MKCKSVPSELSVLPHQEKGDPGMHSRLSEDYEANGRKPGQGLSRTSTI